MKKRLISIIISLSMLTAAMPAVFAASETGEAAAEITETEIPAETDTEEETDTAVPEDGTADAAESEPEPETADTAETPVPEPTEVAETAVPEETAETTAEPGISLMSVVSSGTCGDDLTWTLDYSRTLTISGTGEMTDYSSSSSSRVPWYSSRSSIKSVVIEDGVTYIGKPCI